MFLKNTNPFFLFKQFLLSGEIPTRITEINHAAVSGAIHLEISNGIPEEISSRLPAIVLFALDFF